MIKGEVFHIREPKKSLNPKDFEGNIVYTPTGLICTAEDGRTLTVEVDKYTYRDADGNILDIQSAG